MKPAVFIDRDNTLIEDPGYFHDPDALKFKNGALEALRMLFDKGFALVVITNQSGIGRGIFPQSDADAVHERMEQILKNAGIELAGIYYCPHRPDDNCVCRKPKPYMLRKAAEEHGLDLSRSFLIGNDLKDMQTGKNAGVRTIAVFLKEQLDGAGLVDFNAEGLTEAAQWIITNMA